MPTTPTPPIELGGADQHLEGTWVPVQKSVAESLSSICRVTRLEGNELAVAELSRDWWPLALHWALEGEVGALAAVVVHPTSTEEVSQVMSVCHDAVIPVTAAGGRSGVCGGSIPVHGGVVIDLSEMNLIIEVDEVSGIVTAQCGVFGPDLEHFLRSKHSITVGHHPQSFDLSTVGGWVACRGAGQYSTRYGKIEEMVVGLEVVVHVRWPRRWPLAAHRHQVGAVLAPEHTNRLANPLAVRPLSAQCARFVGELPRHDRRVVAVPIPRRQVLAACEHSHVIVAELARLLHLVEARRPGLRLLAVHLLRERHLPLLRRHVGRLGRLVVLAARGRRERLLHRLPDRQLLRVDAPRGRERHDARGDRAVVAARERELQRLRRRLRAVLEQLRHRAEVLLLDRRLEERAAGPRGLALVGRLELGRGGVDLVDGERHGRNCASFWSADRNCVSLRSVSDEPPRREARSVTGDSV